MERLGLMSSADLATGDYRHEWLIKNLLVRGQSCILGGPFKTLKTGMLIDLALSVGGRRTGDEPPCFLGRFEAPQEPLPVLFFCAESGLATIQETALRVSRARGVDLGHGVVHWSVKLPRPGQQDGLANLERAVKGTGAGLVIIDPLYLCLGGDANIANLGDIGGRLMELSAACTEHGATLVLAHHARKNRELTRRHEPLELDELAFAGVAEVTRQWILVSRRSPFEPGTGRHELWLNVGGSAGASGLYAADVNEGLLRDDFTGRTWEVSVSDGREARDQAAAVRQRAKHEVAEEKIQQDMAVVLEYLATPGCLEGDSATSIAQNTPLSRPRTETALKRLAAQGRVATTRTRKGNKMFDGYRLAAPPAADPTTPTDPMTP